jgi:hypothetical protein
MMSSGYMRKGYCVSSPKSQSPKNESAPTARRLLLNPGASPHANRLARPPRFPEIFEEDEDTPEDHRCQSPTPVTCRRSLGLPRNCTCSTPLVSPVFQAPIITTIQVDIDESLLKQNRARISQRQRSLITVGSGNPSSGSSSLTKSHTTSPPARTWPRVRLAVAARRCPCKRRDVLHRVLYPNAHKNGIEK